MLSRPPVPPDGSGRKVPAAAHAIRRRRSLNLSAYQRTTGRVSPARQSDVARTTHNTRAQRAFDTRTVDCAPNCDTADALPRPVPRPSDSHLHARATPEQRPPIYPHSAHPRAARQWSNDASDRTTRQSRSVICFRPAATPSAGSIGRDRTGFIAHEAGL